MQLSQSDLVRVRRSRWRILEIRSHERCQAVTLAGAERSNRGVVRRVLTPFDVVDRLERRSLPTWVSRRFWRRACRAAVADDATPGCLRSLRDARMELLPHQLEPALAVVRGLGTRVLLADEVGLGKTIQAGAIVSELRARGAADRVLIVTPAGLRDQWQGELHERFGIRAAVLDVRGLRRLVGGLPAGINPWQTTPTAIVSVDYVKRADVLAAAGACRWDALVVDEAHGVATDSERHAAVAELAAAATYVVLLTATPHSGDRRTFVALCGIGAANDDPLLVFRRSRRDLPFGARRRARLLRVRPSRDEARMHELLARFSRTVWRQPAADGGLNDRSLALAVLHKRALSSARSLGLTIERRLTVLNAQASGGASQIGLPLVDLAGELTEADESPAWPPLLALRDADLERRHLEALAGAAARAARAETKVAALTRLLRRVEEPTIVFTEYRDTLLHLRSALALPAAALHGGMARDERAENCRRFACGDVRLLLATDAAGEGLNLQQNCRLVVNLELPWNPMRLEQRIGRVDRIGQRRTVHVVHLVARDSEESLVLPRLLARIANARIDVGADDPLGNWRAPDVERTVARVIITGEPPQPSRLEPAQVALQIGRLSRPALNHDAAAEAARIGEARRFLRTGDQAALLRVESLGPCVASAARWRTRLALAGRTLTLWRCVVEEGSGAAVGSIVIALAVDPASKFVGEGRRTIASALQRLLHAQSITSLIEGATSVWHERTVERHLAFVDARIAREYAIAARRRSPAEGAASGVAQPGLFDRRIERAQLALAAGAAAAEDERTDRTEALARARQLSCPPPQLLLVLVP